MYTSPKQDTILLLLNTVVLVTWLIIVYYRSWLVHVKDKLMRNSILQTLFSKRKKEIVIKDKCLFIKNNKD